MPKEMFLLTKAEQAKWEQHDRIVKEGNLAYNNMQDQLSSKIRELELENGQLNGTLRILNSVLCPICDLDFKQHTMFQNPDGDNVTTYIGIVNMKDEQQVCGKATADHKFLLYADQSIAYQTLLKTTDQTIKELQESEGNLAVESDSGAFVINNLKAEVTRLKTEKAQLSLEVGNLKDEIEDIINL